MGDDTLSGKMAEILSKLDSVSEEQTIEQLVRLAKSGHPEVYSTIGGLYEKGHGRIGKDCTKALAMYRKGIESGDGIFCSLYLARSYFHGICAEKDLSKAYELVRRTAVSTGDPVACAGLGMMLSRGVGCRSDLKEGKEWLWEAWLKGNIMALGHYGHALHLEGRWFLGLMLRLAAIAYALPYIWFDAENQRVRTVF